MHARFLQFASTFVILCLAFQPAKALPCMHGTGVSGEGVALPRERIVCVNWARSRVGHRRDEATANCQQPQNTSPWSRLGDRG